MDQIRCDSTPELAWPWLFDLLEPSRLAQNDPLPNDLLPSLRCKGTRHELAELCMNRLVDWLFVVWLCSAALEVGDSMVVVVVVVFVFTGWE